MQLARGKNRIIYQATSFQTGISVTVVFWNPSLKKEGPYELTELEEGLYFIDVNIAEDGPYIGIFSESGIKIKTQTFRAENNPGIIHKQIPIVIIGD